MPRLVLTNVALTDDRAPRGRGRAPRRCSLIFDESAIGGATAQDEVVDLDGAPVVLTETDTASLGRRVVTGNSGLLMMFVPGWERAPGVGAGQDRRDGDAPGATSAAGAGDHRASDPTSIALIWRWPPGKLLQAVQGGPGALSALGPVAHQGGGRRLGRVTTEPSVY